MAVTTTPAPRHRPARPPVELARGQRDGGDPGAVARYSSMSPAGHLGGQTIPLTKAERHDRPAPGARTTSPDRVARSARYPPGLAAGPGATARLIFRVPTAPACCQWGPDRAEQIGGPVRRSPASDGIRSRLGMAELYPLYPPGLVWLRERSRAVLSRVVSVPFPVPGCGLACPGTGPGKAVFAVG